MLRLTSKTRKHNKTRPDLNKAQPQKNDVKNILFFKNAREKKGLKKDPSKKNCGRAVGT